MPRENKRYSPPVAVKRSPPRPAYTPSSPVYNPPSQSGFFSNLMTGAALGAGSSIGHRAIDAMIPTTTMPGATQMQPTLNYSQLKSEISKKPNCDLLFESFADCYKRSSNDASFGNMHDEDCDKIFEKYLLCKQNQL